MAVWAELHTALPILNATAAAGDRNPHAATGRDLLGWVLRNMLIATPKNTDVTCS